MATVLVLLVTACSDLIVSEDETLTTSQLLFLAQQAGAPTVMAQTFWVVNSRQTNITISHDDNFNTVFAELSFPPGSIASAGGQSLGPGDSVMVTVTPSGSTYRVTVSPTDLVFGTPNPTLKFSASVYGDFSVAAGSPRYSGPEDFFANLKIWEEISPTAWQTVVSTSDAVRTTVSTSVGQGGLFALGAAR